MNTAPIFVADNIDDSTDNNAPSLTIGIVAGEISGDSLGADFMHKMSAIHPNIRWVGVGGTQMSQAGLVSVIDMARLSVMGLVEVVKHLPGLLQAKREILTAFDKANIDIFVGIDAPDFNLRLGKALKPQGVFCVQYVSPSVWAWREGRIRTIKQATDLVLCLFPFELAVYERHQHPAVCVGHPLLQSIRPPFYKDDITASLRSLESLEHTDILAHSPLICVMAGSRVSEINAILPTLLGGISLLQDMDFWAILPVVNAEHAALVQTLIHTHSPQLTDRLHTVFDDGDFDNSTHQLSISQSVMAISDITVLASGTATLEAMLLHAPMVVIYKLAPLTYVIAKHLVKIPYVSLPNILAYEQTGTPIVPELIQDNATFDNIATNVRAVLNDTSIQINTLVATAKCTREQSQYNPAMAVLNGHQACKNKF
ncbi:MAG: lipid-A-disaccharide synthase [Moraxella sp.]|nr:lipid-A-disaccharide synthase [Moraxella sp.]